MTDRSKTDRNGAEDAALAAVLTLTPKQAAAVPLVAAGMSSRDVAKALKCNPKTVLAWKGQQAFREAVQETIRSAFERSQLELAGLLPKVLANLRKDLNSTDRDVRSRTTLFLAGRMLLSDQESGL